MGKCKKRTIKFAKWVGQMLKPFGVRLVRDLVVIMQKTGLSGAEKRELVVTVSMAALGDVKEYAIRAVIEEVMGAMDSIEPGAVDEIGDVADADLVFAAADEAA